MPWDVEYTGEFFAWWDTVTLEEQEAIGEAVSVLERDGPGLGRPLVDTIRGSRHANMKELRVGTNRILFAFDPRRVAILLIGGDKRDRWDAWYNEAIPIADDLYDVYLQELRDEGVL